MTAFPPAALDALARGYPERPATLSHSLADHPLLRLEAIIELAARMRPETVLCLRGDVPVSVGQTDVARNGLDAAATIEAIERHRSWMVLKFVEQDPDYRALVDALLGQIMPVVRGATGPLLKREAFLFVSSPGAVTPLHFDPEHNILIQISGTKTMTLFPPGDEALVPLTAHETFEREGRNNLVLNERFSDGGAAVRLAPGDALYVPVKAPHWVVNGDAPSISLSITWRSGWSMREGYAHGMNRLLRRAGLSPSAPRRFPADNHAKALGYRAILKAQRLLGRG